MSAVDFSRYRMTSPGFIPPALWNSFLDSLKSLRVTSFLGGEFSTDGGGTMLRVSRKNGGGMPCTMGYQDYVPSYYDEAAQRQTPLTESYFWVGHSEQNNASNFNTGFVAGENAVYNKTCYLQNLWIRAERDEKTFGLGSPYYDTKADGWNGSPDKFGRFDLRFNGYDAVYWMLHGHPSEGYFLNTMQKGAFLGTYSRTYDDTDKATGKLKAYENANQHAFLDPNHLGSSNPRLELYKDTRGMFPGAGDYGYGEKCSYYGGTLGLETWSDDSSQKQEQVSNQFRQLIKADAWKSTFLVWQGNNFQSDDYSAKEGKYILADANFPKLEVFADTQDASYGYGYNLKYEGGTLGMMTWMSSYAPDDSWDSYGYFIYDSWNQLLAVGDNQSKNYFGLKVQSEVNGKEAEASLWLYDSKGGAAKNNFMYKWGKLTMWDAVNGPTITLSTNKTDTETLLQFERGDSYLQLLAKDDEAGWWCYDEGGNGFQAKYAKGVFTLWHQGAGHTVTIDIAWLKETEHKDVRLRVMEICGGQKIVVLASEPI
jgi:hypothetical protein